MRRELLRKDIIMRDFICLVSYLLVIALFFRLSYGQN
jgi:hypothetical protein